MVLLAELGQSSRLITPEHGITAIGVGLLAVWLLRTSLGRAALAGSKPRRNRMSPVIPFIALWVWMAAAVPLQLLIAHITGPVDVWHHMAYDTVAYDIAAAGVIAMVLLFAHHYSARGIKGFGLRLRTIPRDLATAALRLLAVWPLVLTAIVVIQVIGRIVSGPSYEIPQHETLKELSEAPLTVLKALLVLAAVVVAPLQEEMLFRGLLQTMIRSYIGRPWIAIALTSIVFAMVHADNAHWPALFVLAMALGYSYEKSGSLFQPIFMHAMFNGVAILSTLSG
jgi:membrane protease YdiL (CAAX protease family)